MSKITKREAAELDRAIEGLEHMKMVCPMLEAHRDTLVLALVLLMKMRQGR
jgi:hypothetical protein